MPSLRAFASAILLPALLLTAGACTETRGMPAGWGPLRLAADSTCPRVYGSFDASDRDFAYVVGTRLLAYDTTRGPVESISLALEGDTLLTAIAWVDNEPRDTVRLRAHREFECGDGWLKPTFPDWLPSDASDSAAARARQSGRTDFRIAIGAKGALVGRLDHHTYREFTVWCGDGCRGVPIPWTWRTAHHWHRATVVDPRTHRITEAATVTPITDRDLRLMREEAILEGRYDTSGPAPTRLQQLVRAALPTGARLRGITSHGDGWHVSLLLANDDALVNFLTALGESESWSEVRVESSYSSKTSDGQVARVVYVRQEANR